MESMDVLRLPPRLGCVPCSKHDRVDRSVVKRVFLFSLHNHFLLCDKRSDPYWEALRKERVVWMGKSGYGNLLSVVPVSPQETGNTVTLVG